MANKQVSIMTAIAPPLLDSDVMYVVQGGVSLKIEMSQIASFAAPVMNADNIPFVDSSTGGLASTTVGDALRELDDNFDNFVAAPTLPSETDTSVLPDPSTVPRGVSYNAANGRPVYSNGTSWNYMSASNVEVLVRNMNSHVRSIWEDSGRIAVCGDDGYIATSDDNGVTFQTRNSGVTTDLRTIKKWGANWYCVGWGTGGAGGSPATALYSTDNGVTWAAMTITTDDSSGGASHLVDIAFSGTKMLFIGFRTADVGGIIDEITSVGSVIEHRNQIANPNYLYGALWDATAALFYIVGSYWDGATSTPYFATSTDGVTHINTTDLAIMDNEIWVVGGNGDGNVYCCQANNPLKIFRNESSGAAGQWRQLTIPSDIPVETDPWRMTSGDGDLMLCGGAWYEYGVILVNIGATDEWVTLYTDDAADYGWRIIHRSHYVNGVWYAVAREPNTFYRITL